MRNLQLTGNIDVDACYIFINLHTNVKSLTDVRGALGKERSKETWPKMRVGK